MILIFQKEGRKFLLPFFIIFSIIFYSIFKYNSEVRTNFISFYLQVTKIYIILSNQDLENQRVPHGGEDDGSKREGHGGEETNFTCLRRRPGQRARRREPKPYLGQ